VATGKLEVGAEVLLLERVVCSHVVARSSSCNGGVREGPRLAPLASDGTPDDTSGALGGSVVVEVIAFGELDRAGVVDVLDSVVDACGCPMAFVGWVLESGVVS